MGVAAFTCEQRDTTQIMALAAHVNNVLTQSGTDGLAAVCLHSLEDIAAWATAWMRLDSVSQARHCYFQSHDWCRAWLEQHGDEGCTPFVIMLLRGSEAVAVLPLMRQTEFGCVRVLRPLGDPHTQYGNVLTGAGTLTACEMALLRQTLQSGSRADSIIINYIPEGSPLAEVLGPETRARELDNAAAQLDLSAPRLPGDHLAGLSKNQRRARRKSQAILGELGPLRLDVLRPGDSGYVSAIHHCVALKKNWIKHTGRIGSGLDYAGHGEFLARLPADTSRDGGIVFALKAGEASVAYEIGFLQRGHYYSYLGAFVWGLRHASPGTLQIEMTLDWLAANGAETFDLLGNPVDYKAQWSNREVALACHVLDLTGAGRIYSRLWVRMVRPMLKSAYHRLPTDVRRAATVLRLLDLSQLKSA